MLPLRGWKGPASRLENSYTSKAQTLGNSFEKTRTKRRPDVAEETCESNAPQVPAFESQGAEDSP
jgi:trans-2-enoyl-CoA reductase